MSLLSLEELKALASQTGNCISLYMPTLRAGAETQQNPIRFKNLIRQVENQLETFGLRNTEIAATLRPAMDLDREEFWQSQQEGLALFIAPDFFRYYCLPLTFQELAIVSDRFHLKPLMPLLTCDGEFFILSLNQDRVRLFRASHYSIEELPLSVPTNIDEALQYEETAKDGQFRISTSKGGTNNSFQHAGSFHGQGSPDRDMHQRDILQFFHLIDQGVQEHLNGRQGPLVMVGVEYLLPIYREANGYQYLIDEAVTENAEILKPEEILAQVWPLVQPYFDQVKQTATERYQELISQGKTSTSLQEVVPAAYYGRVDRLFVPVGVQHWGSFDAQANQVQLHPDREPGDEDLLNAVAIQTLVNGGTVYAVPPEEVPDRATIAAIFRY